jgi:hypothetical protein
MCDLAHKVRIGTGLGTTQPMIQMGNDMGDTPSPGLAGKGMQQRHRICPPGDGKYHTCAGFDPTFTLQTTPDFPRQIVHAHQPIDESICMEFAIPAPSPP